MKKRWANLVCPPFIDTGRQTKKGTSLSFPLTLQCPLLASLRPSSYFDLDFFSVSTKKEMDFVSTKLKFLEAKLDCLVVVIVSAENGI